MAQERYPVPMTSCVSERVLDRSQDYLTPFLSLCQCEVPLGSLWCLLR